MITNPQRLYKNVPPGTVQAYKLTLLRHFFLEPLAKVYDFSITSAYRSINDQADLTDSSGKPVSALKKAKGISQHCMGEAVDIDGEKCREMYQYIIEHLHPWQVILYFEDGKENGIHISMPSENETIVSKRLLNVDGEWRWFRGDYQDIIDLRRA